MFTVHDMNRTLATQGSCGGPSSTSLPQKWEVPANTRKDLTPVNVLELVKHKYGKVPQHTCTDLEPIDPALGMVDITICPFEKI